MGKYPSGFLWGTATAAHQVDGGNVNSDNWLMEHLPGTIFAEPSGDACDHYHRYREDIAMLADLGFNAYRFSIEWARIEPEPGEFSRASLDHYRRMLATCHEHHITPIVTFHHFTSPRWLLTAGGWASKDTPERFARYCETVTRHMGDLMGGACTFNESNLAVLLAKLRFAPPTDQLHGSAWWIAMARICGIPPEQVAPFLYTDPSKSFDIIYSAHRRAVEAIKSGPGKFPVGMTLALIDVQAGEGGDEYAAQMSKAINGDYLEPLRGDDFIGVQTYSRTRFGPNGVLPAEPGVEKTQMGYEFWPEALEATIRHAAQVTGAPIMVTENGIGTDDDSRRIEYVKRALQGVEKCLKDGIDVRGYFYWSAFDNYEWTLGYRPTFGLIAVDRLTQQRTIKPSARWLGEIGRANSFSATAVNAG